MGDRGTDDRNTEEHARSIWYRMVDLGYILHMPSDERESIIQKNVDLFVEFDRLFGNAHEPAELSPLAVALSEAALGSPALAGSNFGRVDWGGVALGLTVAALAGAISYATFSAVESGGGTYVVFSGAVLWGLWKAGRSALRGG